ncbi:hypothetical protein VULLAG_LOCUS22940 [Vulpes lagopus]
MEKFEPPMGGLSHWQGTHVTSGVKAVAGHLLGRAERVWGGSSPYFQQFQLWVPFPLPSWLRFSPGTLCICPPGCFLQRPVKDRASPALPGVDGDSVLDLLESSTWECCQGRSLVPVGTTTRLRRGKGPAAWSWGP